MRKIRDTYELSASDLVGYLNCRHLAALEREVAEGALKKPYVSDPLLKILWERGLIHEQSYVEHLTAAGFEVVRIDGVEVTDTAVAETVAAMKKGVQVIEVVPSSSSSRRRAAIPRARTCLPSITY